LAGREGGREVGREEREGMSMCGVSEGREGGRGGVVVRQTACVNKRVGFTDRGHAFKRVPGPRHSIKNTKAQS